MNHLTELKGEKTVKALAKRLFEQPSNKSARKSSETEMEAALLRLNPHLSQIADLEKGTPILLPDNFPLTREESSPLLGNTTGLLEQSEAALKNLSAALAESVQQAGEQAERVETWLKSDGTQEFLRRAPELREVFSSGAAAAKTVRKEQAALAAAEEKALSKVQSELASFLETTRR